MNNPCKWKLSHPPAPRIICASRIVLFLLLWALPLARASFSDADWVPLGSGVNGQVWCLTISGTNVYAGGDFTTAGGVGANHIAKWDGRAWSPLGSGTDGRVKALAVIGTNLYVGGGFTTAGGVPASNIAKWDGSAWTALGQVPAWYVEALAVSGTNLYAAGNSYSIVKWNGSSWSPVGSVNDYVYALAVGGGNLYAGGHFSQLITAWNGTNWFTPGSGLGGYYVEALATSGTTLYAAGYFTSAGGGVPAQGIAKWDGLAWSPLGSGISSLSLRALAVSGTNLYAGGSFTTAGGVPANLIAKWDGSAWSALGSGLSGGSGGGGVLALAADEAGHLFAGGWFTRAGTNVSPFIAQANVQAAPTILSSPQSQTAEAGTAVELWVRATGSTPLFCLWYLNTTNFISWGATRYLELTNVAFSQAGIYTAVITNTYGAITSSPAMLNVVVPVERRPVAGINVRGGIGGVVNIDYANSLSSAPNWVPLGSVNLTDTPAYCFDLSQPLAPQRFFRAWQTGTPSVIPSLDLHMVPAITLTGTIGGSVRVEAINRFGLTDRWITLDTVTLTNTSQLYFDLTAFGQPSRLYRLVPVP